MLERLFVVGLGCSVAVLSNACSGVGSMAEAWLTASTLVNATVIKQERRGALIAVNSVAKWLLFFMVFIILN